MNKILFSILVAAAIILSACGNTDTKNSEDSRILGLDEVLINQFGDFFKKKGISGDNAYRIGISPGSGILTQMIFTEYNSDAVNAIPTGEVVKVSGFRHKVDKTIFFKLGDCNNTSPKLYFKVDFYGLTDGGLSGKAAWDNLAFNCQTDPLAGTGSTVNILP